MQAMRAPSAISLEQQLYTAWRDAWPYGTTAPPPWEALTGPEQARWRYVAEVASRELVGNP